MKVFAMILPQSVGKKLGSKFSFFTKRMLEYLPELKSDIALSEIDMEADEYLGASIVSSFALGYLMLFGTAVPLKIAGYPGNQPLILAAIPAVLILLLDFLILLRYPKILSIKRGELIDRDLIFALKDLLLHMSAGLSLYNSMAAVSRANYGFVSKDFSWVVHKSNEGMALDDALEELALRSSSEYMRNALWQIINAYRSGAGVKDALTLLIKNLIKEQQRKIRDYTQELNVLTMMYMLFAVAIPSIISTLIVVLTSFMGGGVTPPVYMLIIFICILIQIMILMLIKSRRPLVYLD